MIGLWIFRKIMKLIGKSFDKRDFDSSLKPFLLTLVAFLLKIMLFLGVVGQIGVETTSFIAILGAAGLAIGLALQGSLANFASGVLILIFRPFKVGDLIEGQDQIGFVKEISVFVTVIVTFQNKTVIIPNSPLGGGTIVNYSVKGNVRSDIPFAIRYRLDLDKAKEIVLNVLQSSDKVLQDPAPSVYGTELNSSSIQLTALPFSTVADYWDVYWGLRGEIAKNLGEAGFEAPFEQRVVTMKSA
jgi:small conductance mechanosensitive channel